MAAPWQRTPHEDEIDAELRSLEKEIGKLRSAKKEALEKARPFNERVETIAREERERVDKLHRLMAEMHDLETRRRDAGR